VTERLGRHGTLPIEAKGYDDTIAGRTKGFEEEGSELDEGVPSRSFCSMRERRKEYLWHASE